MDSDTIKLYLGLYNLGEEIESIDFKLFKLTDGNIDNNEYVYDPINLIINILAIVATNSTALINASYFGVFPICIKSKYSLNFYFKEKIVFPLKMNKNIFYKFKKIFNNKKKLNNIKKKLW